VKFTASWLKVYNVRAQDIILLWNWYWTIDLTTAKKIVSKSKPARSKRTVRTVRLQQGNLGHIWLVIIPMNWLVIT